MPNKAAQHKAELLAMIGGSHVDRERRRIEYLDTICVFFSTVECPAGLLTSNDHNPTLSVWHFADRSRLLQLGLDFVVVEPNVRLPERLSGWGKGERS